MPSSHGNATTPHAVKKHARSIKLTNSINKDARFMPLLSIESDSFPYLNLAGKVVADSWGHGKLYSLRLASSFLRITSKGLQFNTVGTFDANNVAFETSWKSFQCNVDENALCLEPINQMPVFPSPTGDTVLVSQNSFASIPVKNSYLAVFDHDNACNRSATGRTLTLEDNRYSITLCDLIDQNLDIFVIFNNDGIKLHWRRDDTSVWLLVFLAVVSIYLVSCIAQNIVNTIQPNKHQTHLREIIAQRVVTLILSVILLFDFALMGQLNSEWHNSKDFVIMQADHRLLWHLLVYVFCELVYQGYEDFMCLKRKNHQRTFASSVSILIACLVLISFRIHFTADNPYIAILTGLFGVRTWYKQLQLYSTEMGAIAYIIQILDVWVFSSLLGNGIINVQSTVFDGTVLQLWILFISVSVGSLLFLYNHSIHP